jgi:large subunit ribosomal protein L21
MAYAVIKTGGKQYRVEEGQTLLVEKLPGNAGDKLELETLLNVGDDVDFGGGTAVQAEIVGHEKGVKLRVVKFKPKRGYKRRTGHRQGLTRIRVVSVGGTKPKKAAAAAKPAAEPKIEEAAT